MASVEIQIRSVVLVLVISLLCFGVCTTRSSSVKNLTGSNGCCSDEETTIFPYGAGNNGNTPYSVRNIKEITVGYSTASLESIAFLDTYGNNFKLGGIVNIPVTTYKIKLEDQEYLTGVTFEVGPRDNIDVVTSITFFTNVRQYGSFGTQGTKTYPIRLHCAKITGFHGGYSWRIDTIGVYFVIACPETAKIVPEVESI